MAQDSDMPRILDRIRKMLALAADEAASEGERDNALRMANNLMAKHQLDMKDIPNSIRDRDDPLGRFELDGFGVAWTHMIRGSIARLFDCRYFMGHKHNATKHQCIFVGRASNATTAMLMSEWVVREAIRGADKAGKHRLTPAGRSFGLGFSARLSQRVNEILANQAAAMAAEHGLDAASTSRALVVIHENAQADNDAWVAANMKTGKSRSIRRGNLDGGAYGAGQQSANVVNLSKQVTARPDPKGIK